MILQGNTSRALTFFGLAAVAGASLLWFPLAFGPTQGSGAVEAGQREEKKADRKPEAVPKEKDREEQLQAARIEFRALQAESEKLQAQMQKHQQEMQKTMQKLADQMQKAAQRAQQLEGQGGPGQGRFGQGGGQGGVPRPGGGPPGGGGWGGPGPGGNFEHRLNQVEQKLDTLLQELRGLRNDMKQAPKESRPNPRPNPNPNPPRRVDPARPGPVTPDLPRTPAEPAPKRDPLP